MKHKSALTFPSTVQGNPLSIPEFRFWIICSIRSQNMDCSTLISFAHGDLEIDAHHTMEDCGIILGDAFCQALGEKKGIIRMASATVPMDESLATVSIDFSGRPYCVIQSNWNGESIAEIPISLFEHFLESFAVAARCNLFVQVHSGKDNHHMCEAIFKALARAVNQACSLDERRIGQIPSTKEKIF